jgi:hypothetical protein
MPSVIDKIEGIIFIRGISNSYASDQPILNTHVPARLDRYVNGVLDNTNFYTVSAAPVGKIALTYCNCLGMQVLEGVNGRQGITTLAAGVATVPNTSTTANSRIFLTSQVDGGTPGSLRISSRIVGVSFTITSSSVVDTSIVAYQMCEPA